ncbi:hypothetical protein [Bacillus sp. FSL K6-3431]|uniref:hypothetical protein n=1 Tax=Bacillus sp. FSL K6-3431 TaxID=2921500 RepID=UPI0030F82E71
MYAEYDLEEDPLEETMTKEQIRDMTDRFLADIFPELSSNLHLSTIADLAVFYVLDYCQKDTRFGWGMPNSGVSFCEYKNRMIMDMTNEVYCTKYVCVWYWCSRDDFNHLYLCRPLSMKK